MTIEEKILKYSISKDFRLFDVLKKMDLEKSKSLIVIENSGFFIGLISIGDIQRAIIKNLPLDIKVGKVLRDSIIIGSDTDPFQLLKDKMLNLRIEMMPIVDKNNLLSNILLWDEIFDHNIGLEEFDSDIPVVIMAGGLGSRLRPLTNIIPKPLLPIGENSIIDVIIEKFRKFGADSFYVSTNYKSELIKFHFENKDCDFSIDIVKEDFPLGTAGSLELLKDKLAGTFFLTNCDIIISTDYTEILKYHRENNNVITIVASVKEIKIPYGIVESGKNGELLRLKEKPELLFMINTGMYVIEPIVFESINKNEYLDITTLIENVKNKSLKVGVFPVSDKSWTDIGEWNEYLKIINKIN